MAATERLEERSLLSTLLYVDNPGDYVITTDQGAPGLDNGDVVTWDGTVAGLTYGTSAFGTIQNALNASAAGDTVQVADGTFNERLVVAKPGVKVIGQGVDVTVVDYTGQTTGQAGVYITGNAAELRNLTVTHASPNTAAAPRYGIKADFATGSSTTPVNGVVIDTVKVSNSFRTGLDLNGVTNITVNQFSAVNNGGAGIFMTDVKGATLSNITTSGNPWAGVSVATFGQFFPLGTSGIVFGGTNSFGESATANGSGQLNGGLQFEMANFAAPASPEPISFSSQAGDGADVTIQAADFAYMVSGQSFDNPNVYRRFYKTLAQAQAAALGTPDHINAGSRYIQDADDSNDFAARVTGFYVYDNPGTNKMSIQGAIDAAVDGDVIHIAAGTYNENLTVNKSVTLNGAGSGGNAAVDTIITAAGNIVTVTANDVTVSDLRVTGGARGVLVNGASGTTLDGIAAVANTSNGVEVGGTTATDLEILDSTLANNSVGFRMGTAANLDGLTIAGSTFSGNLLQGIAVFTAPGGSHLTNVEITGSTFVDNAQKGMYFEKLNNALIDDVTVLNSGTDPTYAFNNGIDINLKHGSYGNIVIQNSRFSGSGVRTVFGPGGLDYASALAIKARNDAPSYNTVPATLTNVVVHCNTFEDSPQNAMTTAIRLGEPGKNNAGPTGVEIHGNNLSDGTFVGVDNTTLAAVDATLNWWGTKNGSTIGSSLARGNVDFTPWLLGPAVDGVNAVFIGSGGEVLVVNLISGDFLFDDGDGLISTGNGARVKNGKLDIHEQDDQGRKIDVKGSADGAIEVVVKPKGPQKKKSFDLVLDLDAVC